MRFRWELDQKSAQTIEFQYMFPCKSGHDWRNERLHRFFPRTVWREKNTFVLIEKYLSFPIEHFDDFLAFFAVGWIVSFEALSFRFRFGTISCWFDDFSWIVAICLVRFPFFVNTEGQIEHLKIFLGFSSGLSIFSRVPEIRN